MEFSIPWVKAMDLSSSYLNEDHHALLDRLNAFLVALSAGHKASVMIEANALRAEAQAHFADEESLMRETNYPDMEKHSERHQELLSGLEELLFRVNLTESFPAMLDASPYLERWFVPHLTRDDKKLADFMANRKTAEPRQTV